MYLKGSFFFNSGYQTSNHPSDVKIERIDKEEDSILENADLFMEYIPEDGVGAFGPLFRESNGVWVVKGELTM